MAENKQNIGDSALSVLPRLDTFADVIGRAEDRSNRASLARQLNTREQSLRRYRYDGQSPNVAIVREWVGLMPLEMQVDLATWLFAGTSLELRVGEVDAAGVRTLMSQSLDLQDLASSGTRKLHTALKDRRLSEAEASDQIQHNLRSIETLERMNRQLTASIDQRDVQ